MSKLSTMIQEYFVFVLKSLPLATLYIDIVWHFSINPCMLRVRQIIRILSQFFAYDGNQTNVSSLASKCFKMQNYDCWP